MKTALLGFAAGVAGTVILAGAHLVMRALHADFYDDDVWEDR